MTNNELEHEYEVEIPISGMAYLTVFAASSESAIAKAMDALEWDNIESWRGDPLEAIATRIDGEEEG